LTYNDNVTTRIRTCVNGASAATNAVKNISNVLCAIAGVCLSVEAVLLLALHWHRLDPQIRTVELLCLGVILFASLLGSFCVFPCCARCVMSECSTIQECLSSQAEKFRENLGEISDQHSINRAVQRQHQREKSERKQLLGKRRKDEKVILAREKGREKEQRHEEKKVQKKLQLVIDERVKRIKRLSKTKVKNWTDSDIKTAIVESAMISEDVLDLSYFTSLSGQDLCSQDFLTQLSQREEIQILFARNIENSTFENCKEMLFSFFRCVLFYENSRLPKIFLDENIFHAFLKRNQWEQFVPICEKKNIHFAYFIEQDAQSLHTLLDVKSKYLAGKMSEKLLDSSASLLRKVGVNAHHHSYLAASYRSFEAVFDILADVPQGKLATAPEAPEEEEQDPENYDYDGAKLATAPEPEIEDEDYDQPARYDDVIVEKKSLCSICRDRPVKMLNQPCSHICMCEECDLSQQDYMKNNGLDVSKRKCIICRAVVRYTQKVYI